MNEYHGAAWKDDAGGGTDEKPYDVSTVEDEYVIAIAYHKFYGAWEAA